MPDFQAFIGILTTLFVFLTGIILNYDSIQLGNNPIIIPQWFGLFFAGLTFSLVTLDQILRGLVRLEKTERETRRTRIETRYRTAIIRFQLNPNNLHRNQLADILALLEEYRDTLWKCDCGLVVCDRKVRSQFNCCFWEGDHSLVVFVKGDLHYYFFT